MSEYSSSKLASRRLNLYFGSKQVLKNVNIDIATGEVTSLIGPSGCGKSTLLRSFNRMHDLNPEVQVRGTLLLDGQDIYGKSFSVTELRRRVGMVFQKPNPLPKSIFDNLAYGLRLHRYPSKEIPGMVEDALRRSHLWEEVKDDLHRPATGLSGGQQQRLCIARALVLRPEVVLMDEPCSALDPISTRKIEDLILSLRGQYTLVVVTHNMQQARRISDRVGFMYMGELVEHGSCARIFDDPKAALTQNYVSGHFG